MSNYSSIENSFTFESFFFKGLTIGGDCTDWAVFTDQILDLPFRNVQFTKLTLAVDNYGFSSKTSSMSTVECEVKNEVERLIDSLQTGATYATICGGHTWRVFTCNEESVICVDCKLNCVKTESCPGRSFIVNPCETCTTYAAASAIFNAEYSVKKLYPLFTLPLNTTASRTSIDVSVEISTAGTVFCAALASGTVVASVADIGGADSATTVVAANAGFVQLAIEDLGPSTAYDVYCHTESFAGDVMQLPDALQTLSEVSTLCCRSVEFLATHSSIAQYISGSGREEAKFVVALDSTPVSQVVVTLSLELISCTDSSVIDNSVDDASILPSAFTFVATSPMLEGTFVIRGVTTGCYRLTASATGNDNYDSASTFFTLTNIRAPPPVPIFAQVLFSNDGAQLYFTFNSNTDRASSVLSRPTQDFNCSLVVLFPSSNSARCKWTSRVQITARYKSTAKLLPKVGDVVTVRNGVLKAACLSNTNCGNYLYMTNAQRLIEPPKNAQKPVARLYGTEVKFCDNMRLDPTASTGNLGREWLGIRWSVGAGGAATGESDIENYLNEHFTSGLTLSTVPNSLLTRSSSVQSSVYSPKITLTNFLNATSVAEVKVVVKDPASTVTPDVRVFGGDETVFRWQIIELFAEASFPACATNSTLIPLIYTWTVYQGLSYINIPSVSANKRYFRLTPYTLEASTTYTIVATVALAANPSVKSTASSTIQLGRSGVSAVITGASSRTVEFSKDFFLDASDSEDIDYPESDELTFEWSCAELEPTFGAACVGFVSSTTAVLDITAGTLAAAKSYTFTVEVRTRSGAVDTAATDVRIADNRVPEVEIVGTQAKYDPERKIVITGQIFAEDDGAAVEWTSDEFEFLAQENITATPLIKSVARGRLTNFQLAIRPNSLTAGLTYNFALNARYATISSRVGVASIAVRINEPPGGGIVTTSPTEGIALSTQFLITTSLWSVDVENLPLNYILGFYLVQPDKYRIVKPVDRLSYVTSVLGQGAQPLNYFLQVGARAIDVFGSAANVTTQVRVIPGGGFSDAIAYSDTAVADALGESDPSAFTQAVSTVTTVINAVDCGAATESYCAARNRLICSETAGTCGPCIAGFVGRSGDSNSYCRSATFLTPIGGRCNLNDSCITARCQQGVCVDAQKECPNDCGGRGTCLRVDSSGASVDDCLLSDTTCTAQCLCDERRFGISCGLLQFQYLQTLETREKLCHGIYRSLSLQDLSADVVQSRALSVADVLIDITTITDAALYNCTLALVETVLSAGDLACVGTSFSTITNSLSAVLAKGTSLPESLVQNVTTALTAMAEACQSSSAAGEEPLTITSNNLQLTVSVVDNGKNNSLLSIAQSEFDSFNNEPANSCDFDTDGLSSTESLSVTLFQYSSNPHGATNSTQLLVQDGVNDDGDDRRRRTRRGRRVSVPWSLPYHLQQEGLELISSSSGRKLKGRKLQDLSGTLDTGVTIVLHNHRPINYIEIPESTINVRCFEWKNHEYIITKICPSGAMLNITCPSRKKGDFDVTCPARSSEPECITWNGFEYAANPDCVVVDYTAYNTTCFCEGATARRLQSTSDGALEFASRFAVIGTNIGTTFIAAPSLTDVKNNLVILFTLIGVLVVFVVGFFFFRVWDWKDRRQEQRALERSMTTGKKKVRTVYGFYNSMFPDELRAAPWYVIYWGQMQIEHPWVALVSNYDNIRDARATKWSMAMGRLLIFLFVNCIVSSVLFPDDGYCEQFDEKDTCDRATTPGGLFKTCEWIKANESCRFNEPDITFLASVILALIVSLLSIPFDNVLDFCIYKIVNYFHFRRLAQQTDPGELIPPLKAKRDEFATTPSIRSTMLQAARLEKARKTMDYILPAEEALVVALEAEALQARMKDHRVFFRSTADLLLLDRRHYGQHTTSATVIQSRIEDVRNETATMRKEMEELPSQEERELYMIKQFIVTLFTGHERAIASRYFLRDYQLKRTDFVRYQEYFCLLFLPMYMALLIYYIYVFNLSIGSKATDIWLIVTFLAFAQDVFVLYPTKIWVNWIVINNAVSESVRDICERLIARSRLILMRTSGVMRNANALVQHFNPACRLARMYPQYPISRLLLSINDHDLPPLRRKSIYAAPYFYFTFGLLLIAYLPELLQETALDIITSTIIDFSALAFYFLGVYVSPVIAALLVLLLAGGLAFREWWRHRSVRNAAVRKQKAFNADMFDAMDAEDDVAHIQPEDVDDHGTPTAAKMYAANKLLKPLQGLSERSFRSDAGRSQKSFRGEVPMELVDCSDSGDSDDEGDEPNVHLHIPALSSLRGSSTGGSPVGSRGGSRRGSVNSMGASGFEGNDMSTIGSIASTRSFKPSSATAPKLGLFRYYISATPSKVVTWFRVKPGNGNRFRPG